MLEQKIDDLIAAINELTATIKNENSPAKSKPTPVKNKAKNDNVEELKPEPESDVESDVENSETAPAPIGPDEVRKALIEVKNQIGEECAHGIMKEHGGSKLFSKIDESNYPAILDACNAAVEKQAA